MDALDGRTIKVVGGGKREYVRSLCRLVPNHQGQARLGPSLHYKVYYLRNLKTIMSNKLRTVVLVFNPLNLYTNATRTIHLGEHQHKTLSLPCQHHNGIILSEQCIHSNHTGSFPLPFPFPFLVPSHPISRLLTSTSNHYSSIVIHMTQCD
jgi:hypothetical protein